MYTNRTITHCVLFYFVFATLWLSMQAAAADDSEGFRENWGGSVSGLYALSFFAEDMPIAALRSPGIIRSSFDKAWAQARPAIMDQIRSQMQEQIQQNTKMRGDAHVELPEKGELRMKLEGRLLQLKYLIPHSEIKFYISIPVEADPEFSITFDTEVRVDFAIPSSIDSEWKVQSAIMSMKNAKIDSLNPTGDAAMVLVPLIKPGAFKAIETRINAISTDMQTQVNDSLGEVRRDIPKAMEEAKEKAAKIHAPFDSHPYIEAQVHPDVGILTMGLVIRLLPHPSAPEKVTAFNLSPSGDIGINWTVDRNTDHVEIEEKTGPTSKQYAPLGGSHSWKVVATAPRGKAEAGHADINPLFDGTLIVPNPKSRPGAVKPYTYQVCASNAAGRTCSAPVVATGTKVSQVPDDIDLPQDPTTTRRRQTSTAEPTPTPTPRSFTHPAPSPTPTPVPQKRKSNTPRRLPSADSTTPSPSPAEKRSMILQKKNPTTNGDTRTLNPQPIPPGIPITLKGGLKAEVSGNILLISNPNGTRAPAKPGRYFTTDGRVIVVDEQGKVK
jgi:hypothetical protein